MGIFQKFWRGDYHEVDGKWSIFLNILNIIRLQVGQDSFGD